MTDKNSHKSKKKQKTEDIWDISIYTDDEIIHNILNMSNPTDRELEIKIWTYIKNYQQQPPTPQNKQWLKFYEQIYDRLFTFEKEAFTTENLEEEEDAESERSEESENETQHIQKTQKETKKKQKEGLTEKSQSNSDQIPLLVKQTDYIKGSLNPILKETITRTLTIDSQYRENKSDYTTQFSLNLTETIRDVVSIKLYSVHIPYTWYTISTDYGSNYVYLAGNAPGIDNGYYIYPITIEPGNYTQITLTQAVNDSIKKDLIQAHTDICFGTTALSYNPNNSLMTFTIDIQNIFSESFYYLNFPLTPPATYISPDDNPLKRARTITSFLGFTDLSYNFTTVTSQKTFKHYKPSDPDTAVSYKISSTSNPPNNKIYFYQYLGPSIDTNISILNPTTKDPNFLQLYSITIPDNDYSVSSLTPIINNLIQSATFLTNSSFGQYNISDNDPNSNSYFQFNLQLNRNTTVNQQNAKLVVLLPNDVDSNNIWTSSSSCFRFISNQPPITESSGNTIYSYYPFYINSINSEYPSLQTNYIIGNSTKMVFTCITKPWDVLQNNLSITIPPSSKIGYTLTEYMNTINNAIINYSNVNNNIFNIVNSYCFIGEGDSNIHFRFDINKTFNEKQYVLDLSGTSFTAGGFIFYDNNNNLIDLYSPLDLSINNVFNYTLTGRQGFELSYGSSLMKIRVKQGTTYGNQNDSEYEIVFTSRDGDYNKNQSLSFTNAINKSIIQYQNPISTNLPLNTSTFVINNGGIADENNNYHGTMTINLNNTLTEKNYTLAFVDPSNSWFKNFDLSSNLTGTDVSYALTNYIPIYTTYSEIHGYNAIYNNEIYISDLSGNNTFQLSPLPSSTSLQYKDPNPNDFTFTIPNGIYTREQLINVINNQFKLNPLTTNTSLSVYTDTGSEKTNILININKTYTSSDYNIVFYDDNHFSKCAFGTSKAGVTTWDTTLGWILGFRQNTIYDLANYIKIDKNLTSSIPNLANICVLTADTTCSTTLYNYFIITLDDYNQNHVNDGLVTITTTETSIPIPSYATLSNFICNPDTGLYAYTGIVKQGDAGIYNNLTQKQIYAITEIMNNNPNTGYIPGNTPATKYSKGPFVRDVLAIVPIKTAGLSNGQTIIIDSGSLQNQNRVYFGPVNINRLNISLMDDRGHVINLNNSNWSFTLLIDQLYKNATDRN